ncbi:dienelactone hydrolase family protein [Terrilactibacillus sp. S3-3]|nr:dienelactone hydrolase family protein [Terrilactibacillus sp. S3-3]
MRSKETAIVLIHEIYGINKQIKSMQERLSGMGADVFCPNLLDKDPFPYTEEKKAYRYFMNHVGFESGAEQINKIVKVTETGLSEGRCAWFQRRRYDRLAMQ